MRVSEHDYWLDRDRGPRPVAGLMAHVRRRQWAPTSQEAARILAAMRRETGVQYEGQGVR